MKRLILALIMAGTIATVNAQEPKSLLVYGNIGLGNINDSMLNYTSNWVANIGVGYQFNRYWTLGGTICWGQNSFKDYNANLDIENYYRIGPFVRFSNYLNNSNIFFWYAQFDLQYEGGYHTYSNGDATNNKHTGIYAGVYPAIGVNLCRGLCLNFSIGGMNYTTDKSENSTAVAGTNTFNLTFGHMVSFGINKNFNVGHKMHVRHEPGDEVIHRNMEKDNTADDDDAPRPRRKRLGGEGNE